MNKLFFYDKRILITGGTGTVGRQIIQRLLPFKPHCIIVFSRNENEQAAMENEYKESRKIKFFLGDIRDRSRIIKAARKVDYIFHTAALKHVNACEINPIEAVNTNILGTQNVIEAALLNKVRKVILTSSDKAVNPANTMGATKLMAEKLMTAANFTRGAGSTVFASVRFGNVMGSRGSVIPIFKEQIQRGGPVTVTDPEMTRFIMDNEEAVKLLFKALEMARGGEVFVAKMPVIRLGDLVEVMIEEFAPQVGLSPDGIKVNVTGVKPGEKVYEELVSENEIDRLEKKEDLLIIKPSFEAKTARLRVNTATVNSYKATPLTKEELVNYFRENNLLGG
ncbi:MAG: SDR family NAD(P)-dependent oxidoreductase [Clostridia bacterium]|nr:SDR family NAD(P)-dependent oxidoreductase [Clostridia bacterium]